MFLFAFEVGLMNYPFICLIYRRKGLILGNDQDGDDTVITANVGG